MSENLCIRFANSNDAAEMAAIYSPYVQNTTISFEAVPPDGAELARRMQAVQAAGLPWLACQNGGGLVGYAYAGRYGERAGYDWSATASVYVRQDARRQGAGRALYGVLIDLLRTQGWRSLYANISQPNPGSNAFHEAMGFRRQGLFPEIGYKFGQPVGVATYMLPLLPVTQDPPRPLPVDALDKAVVRAILGGRALQGDAPTAPQFQNNHI